MSLFLEGSAEDEKLNQTPAQQAPLAQDNESTAETPCVQQDTSTAQEPADTFEPSEAAAEGEESKQSTENTQEKPEEEPPAAEDQENKDPADGDQTETAPKNEGKGASSLIQFIYDTVELIAVSLVAVMVILTVFARHSPVNGSSMYPTILGRSEGSALHTIGEDTLLISNFLYTPKKGDIVVVQVPNIKGESNVALSLGHPIVKRIIATEHDRVSIDFINWRIEINGKDYEAGFGSADYVNYEGTLAADGTPSKPMVGFYPSVVEALEKDERCDFEQEGSVFTFTVPEGQVFILGDNRNNSKDSRAIGLVDERWIIGKSIIRIYPFDRIGVVD